MNGQSGNVFFFIMLGIVLFGALSFAVVNSSKNTDTSIISENEAKLSQGQIDSYLADIKAGQNALQLDGCSKIIFTPPELQSEADRSCHLFHSDGGGVKYRSINGTCQNESVLPNLDVGERCGTITFVGVSGVNRIYTTLFDLGRFKWNNGTANYTVTGATSSSDGLANTNTLIGLSNPPDAGAPYAAATACRSLGPKWYLPALDELNLLYANREIVGGFQTKQNSRYWSSTEVNANATRDMFFGTGQQVSLSKSLSPFVRCVRRD
jgi:hypothetical protein